MDSGPDQEVQDQEQEASYGEKEPEQAAAAATVSGGSINDWVEWRSRRGQTLDEVYRKGNKP